MREVAVGTMSDAVGVLIGRWLWSGASTDDALAAVRREMQGLGDREVIAMAQGWLGAAAEKVIAKAMNSAFEATRRGNS